MGILASGRMCLFSLGFGGVLARGGVVVPIVSYLGCVCQGRGCRFI